MIKIYRCINSNWLTQGFSDNLACIQNGKVIPGTFPGTCPAGSTKLYHSLGMKSHGGYDRASYYKEPGYFDTEADFLGQVVKWNQYIEIDSAGGLGIDVVSDRPFVECTEGCLKGTLHYVKRRFWHNASAIVNGEEWDYKRCQNAVAGQERVLVASNIALGQKIFLSGSTGLSGGNHVHDALKWCDQYADGIHSDNGYYGAFDYIQWHENVFILDVLKVKHEALSAIELARKIIFQIQAFLQRKVGGLLGSFGSDINFKMSNFLQGRKTYIGLAVALLGVLGFGSLISEEELGRSVDLVLELVGIAVGVYGRFVARPR